jgi:hypothetical protein
VVLVGADEDLETCGMMVCPSAQRGGASAVLMRAFNISAESGRLSTGQTLPSDRADRGISGKLVLVRRVFDHVTQKPAEGHQVSIGHIDLGMHRSPERGYVAIGGPDTANLAWAQRLPASLIRTMA